MVNILDDRIFSILLEVGTMFYCDFVIYSNTIYFCSPLFNVLHIFFFFFRSELSSPKKVGIVIFKLASDRTFPKSLIVFDCSFL